MSEKPDTKRMALDIIGQLECVPPFNKVLAIQEDKARQVSVEFLSRLIQQYCFTDEEGRPK